VRTDSSIVTSEDETTDVQLDISEYEGHTEGKWDIDVNCNLKVNDDEVIGTVEICFPERPNDEADSNGYETSMNYKLIADAPLLLEEVKRLRKELEWFKQAINITADHIPRRAHWDAYVAEMVEKGLWPDEPED